MQWTPLIKEEFVVGIFTTALALLLFIGCYFIPGRRTTNSKAPESN